MTGRDLHKLILRPMQVFITPKTPTKSGLVTSLVPYPCRPNSIGAPTFGGMAPPHHSVLTILTAIGDNYSTRQLFGRVTCSKKRTHFLARRVVQARKRVRSSGNYLPKIQPVWNRMARHTLCAFMKNNEYTFWRSHTSS